MVKKKKKGDKKGLLKYSAPNFLICKSGPEPEFISFLSEVKNRGKLVDVGCGIGLESDYAQKLGFEVVAIDNNYSCIKKAKEINHRVDFKQMDIFNFVKKVPKNEFSVVLDSKFSNRLTLGHLKRYYKNIAKALQHNGLMYLQVLSTEDTYCKKHCPKRKWTKIKDVYIRFFSKKELIKLLRLTGLKVEQFKIVKQKSTTGENEERQEETYYVIIAKQTIKKW